MDTSTPTPGKGLLLQGLMLALIALAAFFTQGYLQLLFVPWYLPILVTVGLLFALAALVKGRSLGRWIGFVFLLLLTGAAWGLIGMARLPAYDGPLAEGKAFPAFTAVRTDGTPFTQRDLEGDVDNILFFSVGDGEGCVSPSWSSSNAATKTSPNATSDSSWRRWKTSTR